jgi:hypothetical protein
MPHRPHSTRDEDETRDDDALEAAVGEDAFAALDQLDDEMLSDEPFPQGPNDEGFDADPTVEAAAPRVSDDDDLATEGSGLRNTPLRGPYEAMARRSELARRLEELLVDAEEWARDDGSEGAMWIFETLADAYEQLEAPPEDTIEEEPDVLQAEASAMGGRSATQRGLAGDTRDPE